MRVYYAGNDRGNHMTIVAPAADPRGIAAGVDADWLDEAGNPRQITVTFKNGEANVPDALGRYLVAVKIAKRTRLLLPKSVAA